MYGLSNFAATADDVATIMLLLFAIPIAIFSLYLIPGIICNWILFKKAGRGGWESIVPIYNTVVMAEIAKKPIWMGVLAAVLPVAGNAFRRSMPALQTLIALVAFGFTIYILANYYKQYTLTGGQIVLLILFPIIAVFTINKVQYKSAIATAPQAAMSTFQPTVPVAQQPQFGFDQPVAPVAVAQPQPAFQPAAPVQAFAPVVPVAPAEPIAPVAPQPQFAAPQQPALNAQPQQPVVGPAPATVEGVNSAEPAAPASQPFNQQ